MYGGVITMSSTLDLLENYLSSDTSVVGVGKGVFNVATPEGAFFERLHSEGFSMYNEAEEYTELHDLLTVCGNQVINAIAGSGKTTALGFKLIHDIVTGEVMKIVTLPNGNAVRVVDRVWVCTFLRTGASELNSSLSSWQRKLGYAETHNQISFSTLDAEFKRCLNEMGVSTNIGKSSDLFRLFKKAVDTVHIVRGDGSKLDNDDYRIIQTIVTYYRGRLDDKKYSHPSVTDYKLYPMMLDLLVNQYSANKQAEGIIDIDDMQELLYKYLYLDPSYKVQEFVASRYNYIYIDEFQDTSQMQYAILRFYARGHLWINCGGDEVSSDPIGLYIGRETKGKIVAIGDPSQCIYSFKGADSSILIEKFDKDFRPTISTLSYNYRCPSNILNPIVPSIHLNSDSAGQSILPFNEGGIFNVFSFATMGSMISKLVEDVKEDIKSNLSVAIICRTNFDGMIPAFMLESDRESIDFSISGDGMTLNSPLPRSILGVAKLFTERDSPAIRTSLELLTSRSIHYKLKKLVDTLKLNRMRLWDVPEVDLKYSCPEILELVRTCKAYMVGEDIHRGELRAFKYLLMQLSNTTFKSDTSYCMGARSYIDVLLFLLNNYDFSSVQDFWDEVGYVNDHLVARVKRTGTKVKIVTVHEAKGKEYDSTYIWNDSVNVFPSAKTDLSVEDQVAEERRVHYIACTRAKHKEVIYTLNNKHGMFLKEMSTNIGCVGIFGRL